MHLITRPEPQASMMAHRLNVANIPTLVDPLLYLVDPASALPKFPAFPAFPSFPSFPAFPSFPVFPASTMPPPPVQNTATQWDTIPRYTALITTSVHALSILAAHSPDRAKNIKIWVVGRASYDHAKNLGFTHIATSQGTAQHLLQDILRTHQPTDALLYLSGADITLDLAAELTTQNRPCDRWIIYRMGQKTVFSDKVTTAFKAQTIRDVSLYSRRTAEAFFTAVVHAGISLRTVTLICKSQAIAQYCYHRIQEENLSVCSISTLMDVDQPLRCVL